MAGVSATGETTWRAERTDGLLAGGEDENRPCSCRIRVCDRDGRCCESLGPQRIGRLSRSQWFQPAILLPNTTSRLAGEQWNIAFQWPEIRRPLFRDCVCVLNQLSCARLCRQRSHNG